MNIVSNIGLNYGNNYKIGLKQGNDIKVRSKIGYPIFG